MIAKWVQHSYSLELRKLISYRLDFWVNFLGSIVVSLSVNYFLWSAIFEARGTSEIGGYSFRALMFYYLLAPLIERSVVADAWTNLSTEIYEGTLTRYIVYPMPVLPFKFAGHLAKTTVGFVQLMVTLCVLGIFIGPPEGVQVSLWNVLQTTIVIFFASYLFFIINLAVEMVAFWADSVWSLLVMVKFSVSLLGGSYLPLTLFPEPIRNVLEWLPFSYFISFPIRCFMGQVPNDEWFKGLFIVLVWSLAITLVSHWLWRKGSKNYTGVGQ